MTPPLPAALLGALALLLQHDDPHLEHVYFWSAILIVLTPAVVFGGIGVWLYKLWRRERSNT
jgi:lipopolysaccharide export LptBFGC system permease protein LptF